MVILYVYLNTYTVFYLNLVNKLVYRNKSKLILHSKEIWTRHHAIPYVTNIFFNEFVNFANILHTAWLNLLFA